MKTTIHLCPTERTHLIRWLTCSLFRRARVVVARVDWCFYAPRRFLRTNNNWEWVFRFLHTAQVSTHRVSFYAPRRFLRTDYGKKFCGGTLMKFPPIYTYLRAARKIEQSSVCLWRQLVRFCLFQLFIFWENVFLFKFFRSRFLS